MGKPYKKPDAATFRKIVNQCGGNMTLVAKTIGVYRSTICDWEKADPEFKRIVKDERMKMFDECVVTARTVAMGVPRYEMQVDKDGVERKVFVGWEERPDGQMLRYMMSTLGRTEGFGESPVDESDGTVKSGVPIRAWIMKMNEGETE